MSIPLLYDDLTLFCNESNVSRVERGQDVYLSTLRSYVEALGGRLELTAVFPDQTITLGSSAQGQPGRQIA